MKRRSRSNPSWNIQDEIRKVRAKATEEMLKTASPSSVAPLEPKHITYVDGGIQGIFFLYLHVETVFSAIDNMKRSCN